MYITLDIKVKVKMYHIFTLVTLISTPFIVPLCVHRKKKLCAAYHFDLPSETSKSNKSSSWKSKIGTKSWLRFSAELRSGTHVKSLWSDVMNNASPRTPGWPVRWVRACDAGFTWITLCSRADLVKSGTSIFSYNQTPDRLTHRVVGVFLLGCRGVLWYSWKSLRPNTYT